MSVASRRQRERQERRSNILDAAEAVFATQGFAQTTMDDIAAEADLSKGTLYLYFKSKEDLLVALASRSIDKVATEYELLARSDRPGIETLRAMLSYHAKHILARPHMFRLMVGNLANGHALEPASLPSQEHHRCHVVRIVDACVSVIERGRRDGSMRPELDPWETSALLWGGLIGTLLLRIGGAGHHHHKNHRGYFNLDVDSFVDRYLDLVCSGLTPANSESTE